MQSNDVALWEAWCGRRDKESFNKETRSRGPPSSSEVTDRAYEERPLGRRTVSLPPRPLVCVFLGVSSC